MAKKNKSRKELLKQPDEFLTLSARGVEFVRSRTRQLKYAGIALAIVACAYGAVQIYLNRVNDKGQTAYNAGYYSLIEKLKPESKAADWKQAGDLFQKVVADYGLSKAARLSFPQIGFVDFRNGNYDEAVASYEKYLGELPQDSPYRPLGSLAVASCWEAKGNLKKAIEALSPAGDGQGVFSEPILLSLARLYREDGQKEKARGVLKDFIEGHESSPFLPMAKAQLDAAL